MERKSQKLPKIKIDELNIRNGRLMPEMWVAYKGLVYDVTASELFVDGFHYKLPTGCDLTDKMEKAPHLDNVMDDFPIVGRLEYTN